jgi:hypothetical protein
VTAPEAATVIGRGTVRQAGYDHTETVPGVRWRGVTVCEAYAIAISVAVARNNALSVGWLGRAWRDPGLDAGEVA